MRGASAPDLLRDGLAAALLALIALAPGAARATVEPWVRFEGVKKTRLELAWQNAVITEHKTLTIKLRVGGRGVQAVHFSDPFTTHLLKAAPSRDVQVLSARARLGEGANLVQACPITAAGRVSCFRIWVARVPARGRPPVVALFERPELSGTTFLRGVVLGHGATQLAVQTPSMVGPFLLDGELAPGRTAHDFVAQVELKPEDAEVCFIVGTSAKKPTRRCIARCEEGACASGPQLHALIVTPLPVGRVDAAALGHFGPDAVFLADALRRSRPGELQRTHLLSGDSATAELVLSQLQQMLAQVRPGDLLLLAYLGPVQGRHPGSGLALGPDSSGLSISVQSLVDLVDQAQRRPQLLLLLDTVLPGGGGAGPPELSTQQPTCLINASEAGQPSIRSDKLGGSLFSQVLARLLRPATGGDDGPRSVSAIYAALSAEVKAQSEGSQHTRLTCWRVDPETMALPLQ